MDRGKEMAFISCMCGGYSACAHQYGAGETTVEATTEAIKRWNTRAKETRR